MDGLDYITIWLRLIVVSVALTRRSMLVPGIVIPRLAIMSSALSSKAAPTKQGTAPMRLFFTAKVAPMTIQATPPAKPRRGGFR